MVKERIEHDFWISGYFSANRAINFANIPYWVSASVQGALLAATRNDNADKTQNVSIDPAHALASSLAVAASRVMLGFVQRITFEINLEWYRILILGEILNPKNVDGVFAFSFSACFTNCYYREKEIFESTWYLDVFKDVTGPAWSAATIIVCSAKCMAIQTAIGKYGTKPK